jgi:hypothetical protein
VIRQLYYIVPCISWRWYVCIWVMGVRCFLITDRVVGTRRMSVGSPTFVFLTQLGFISVRLGVLDYIFVLCVLSLVVFGGTYSLLLVLVFPFCWIGLFECLPLY